MTHISAVSEVLDFLNSIEGAGYGGMASFEIARSHVQDMLNGSAEIDRLREAKRRALQLADERAKEAAELRQTLNAAATPMLADIEQIISDGWRNGKTSAEVAEDVLREFGAPAQGSRDGLLFLASELEAFHDCADGDVAAGNGHFRLECLSESNQQRLNLRAVLREAATALRLVAGQPAASLSSTVGDSK